VRHCDSSAAVPPPAMFVAEVLVTPSDGVIVSPEDIALSLGDRLGEAEIEGQEVQPNGRLDRGRK
jgi:hypothetical protein